MLPDRLKGIFRSSGAAGDSSSLLKGRSASTKESVKEIVTTRTSRGLEQFFSNIRDQNGLSILDLGGAVQDNINFVTGLGHRITPQSLVQSLDETFGGSEADQSNPSQIDAFLMHNLDYLPDTFDGVLLWDTLQFMSPALVNAVVDRLHFIVRPKSYMLVYFNSEERAKVSPIYSFRVQDKSTLRLIQRGTRPLAQSFNNRGLEKLFARFDSVKFFLTRESLREIIVRR
ncbi:MAG TPA: hypothetical protein VGL72_18495 [Bryobacteraceae bacterium]